MIVDKIPVNVISGFLGSGKTTAIIKLLQEKTRDELWAVIINEFGKISIDGQTLQSSSDSENIFEISGGCICCSAKGYFQENLDKIITKEKYSRIIIEPSGLGGIEMVTDIVSTYPNLKLKKVICLVDFLCVSNSRLQQLPIYKTQIRKADLIVFTKGDLLEDPTHEEHLIELFKSYYPEKQYIVNYDHKDFRQALLDMDDQTAVDEIKFRMILNRDSRLTDNNYDINNLIFNIDTEFSTHKLTQFFIQHTEVLRAKGHLLTEKGWTLVNYTLSGCIFEPCQPKNQGELVIISERWPIDETGTLKEQIISTLNK